MNVAEVTETLRVIGEAVRLDRDREDIVPRAAALVDDRASLALVLQCLRHENEDVVSGAAVVTHGTLLDIHYETFDTATRLGWIGELVTLLRDPNINTFRGERVASVLGRMIDIEPFEDPAQVTQPLWEIVRTIMMTGAEGRARGMQILVSLQNELPDFALQINDLAAYLSEFAADASTEVQWGTARLILVLCRQDDLTMWRAILPAHMPWVLSRIVPLVQAHGMSLAAEFFAGVLTQLEFDAPWVNDLVERVIARTFDILALPEFDRVATIPAMMLLQQIVALRPKLLVKRKLIQPMATRVIELLCAVTTVEVRPPAVGFSDNVEEELVDTIVNVLLGLLDTMASGLPAKHAYQPITTLLAQCLMHSSPQAKRVGATGLGFVAEGFHAVLRDQLGDLVPLLLRTLQSEDNALLEGVLFALAELKKQCIGEMQFFDRDVLEALSEFCGRITDDSVRIRFHYTISGTVERWDDDAVREFAPKLMPLLAQSVVHTVPHVRTTGMYALAILGASLEPEDLAPYLPDVRATLGELLNSSDRMISVKAMEIAGYLGTAVGAEHFRDYVAPGMAVVQAELATADIDEPSGALESVLKFIPSAIQTVKRDFAEYMPWLVPALLRVADFPDEPIDDEISLCSDQRMLALSVLVEVCEACNHLLWPYVATIRGLLLRINDETYVASGLCYNLMDLYLPLCTAYWHQGAVEERGLKPVVVPGEVLELPAAAKALLDEGIRIILQRLAEEEGADHVIAGLTTLEKIVTVFGFAAIVDVHDSTLELLGMLLRGEAPCQQVAGDDHDSDDEEDVTADDILEAAVSFVEEVALALGPHVIPMFELTFAATSTCFDPNGAYLIRDRAMGMFSTVFKSIGPAAANYLDRTLPLVEQGLRDKSAFVRQNSSFTLRILCEELKDQLLPNYPAFLQWLYPVCQRRKNDAGAAATDNALAAVASMILLGGAAIPMAAVLPAFLASFPLEKDMEEYNVVVECLVRLVEQQQAVAMEHLPKIVSVLVAAIEGDELEEEKEELLQHLFRQQAASLAPSVEALSNDEKLSLTEFLRPQRPAGEEDES